MSYTITQPFLFGHITKTHHAKPTFSHHSCCRHYCP